MFHVWRAARSSWAGRNIPCETTARSVTSLENCLIHQPGAGDGLTLVRCEQCHHEVPALEFCVRCGDPLIVEKQRAALGRRSQFAAAPEELALGIHLSTLFPQLPRADMATFQLVLIIGVAAIVGLAAFGFFPLAFAAALVLVPLMMVLYVWDVDVYEDEPLRVMIYTAGWGIVTGAIVGLAIRVLLPAGEGLLVETSTTTIVTRGIVIPLIGAALMLAGPLVLLPYRKFNDVLDGATFGATTAATFVAAQAFTQALELFGGGLRPAGDPLPWIVRLLSLGVAVAADRRRQHRRRGRRDLAPLSRAGG